MGLKSPLRHREMTTDIVDVTRGAISGAKDLGLSVEHAASAAATGAFEAAEEIGESAVHAVRDIAASGVNGVKAVIVGQQDS